MARAVALAKAQKCLVVMRVLLRRVVLQLVHPRTCTPSPGRCRTISGTPEIPGMKDPSTPISNGHSLEYRGFRFELRAERMRGGYEPIVVLVRTPADEEETQLARDTEEIVYGTEAEAIRHAEQQAMRWVHDRTGTGQAQF
jgi:hypothetical protein